MRALYVHVVDASGCDAWCAPEWFGLVGTEDAAIKFALFSALCWLPARGRA